MNWNLIVNFTRQDLIDRHSASMLGAAWTFILPLINILIFTLVFSNIMGMRLGGLGQDLGRWGYSVYLVSGLLAWNCFAATLSRITQVFHDKAHLIGKVRMSLWTLPVYVVLSETVHYLIATGFFMIFLIAIDFHFTWSLLWWIPIFLCQQLLAYALGMTCAILSVFMRDIGQIVGVVVQLWFWLTPIVYVANILPGFIQQLVALNPFYHLVLAYRAALITGEAPHLLSIGVLVVFSVALLAIAIFVGRKLERDIRDFL
ncbi:ABC transporter permease [Pseudomonas abietaniphila]|uniref:ABC transporter permease n=1 Tax=Pseudomonas abietaniphila TaxID=89065 RepID=UPI0007804BF6|nr:ABC transporter permease [Pseudomonas abietaniphila]